jgi:transcriptional regulator with XRE-family HTH domain
MDFAELLTTLMTERDVNGCELARRVHCDRSLVYKYRQGRQKPSLDMAGRFDKALAAEGALYALAGAAQPQPPRRVVLAGGLLAGALLTIGPDADDRPAWAARNPPPIDAAVVESLAAVLAGQRRAEDMLGAPATLKPALAQLEAIEDLVRQARGPVRPALVTVAMQWAQFVAYLHRDMGSTAAEQARLAQALEWATEIDDRTMTATVLVNRARMALLAGEVGSAIGLAQAAQRDPVVAAGQRAYGADLEASAHAMAGDCAMTERKLGDTAEFAALLHDHTQDRRPWSYWMSPAWFQCQRGITLGWLAHDPRFRDLAVTELESGYAALPDNEKPSAWAALYLGHLAAVHARAGDVDKACAAGLQTAAISRQTGSVRLARMVAQVHAALSAQHPGDPRVAELADALA